MLTAARALTLNYEAGAELPRLDWLQPLYDIGATFREGELTMIAGRSGSQKSGLALALSIGWGLPTLYMSADMNAGQASKRVAQNILGERLDQVESGMLVDPGRYITALQEVPITFSFGRPIRWQRVVEELEAWVEVYNDYPRLIVIDNLMDIEGATADYTPQMEAMQNLTEMTRHIGSTGLVLHHASDKTWEAKTDPWKPPRRDEIKGGMSEKPEFVLTVALDPTSHLYRIACVKQRMGPSDPSAQRYATLRARPERTQFEAYDGLSTI